MSLDEAVRAQVSGALRYCPSVAAVGGTLRTKGEKQRLRGSRFFLLLLLLSLLRSLHRNRLREQAGAKFQSLWRTAAYCSARLAREESADRKGLSGFPSLPVFLSPSLCVSLFSPRFVYSKEPKAMNCLRCAHCTWCLTQEKREKGRPLSVVL